MGKCWSVLESKIQKREEEERRSQLLRPTFVQEKRIKLKVKKSLVNGELKPWLQLSRLPFAQV